MSTFGFYIREDDPPPEAPYTSTLVHDTGNEVVSIDCSSDGSFVIVGENGGLSPGLYISSDFGNTFTPAVPVVDATYKFYQGVACSGTGQYLLACRSSDPPGKYTYLSTDYGATWNNANVDGANKQRWGSASISNDGQHMAVTASGAGVFVSNDYGATWTKRIAATQYYHCDVSADGSHMAVCKGRFSNGEVWISSNYGVTWVNRTPVVYSTIGYWDVALSATGQRVVVGTADTGYGPLYLSNDYGVTWTQSEPHTYSGPWNNVATDSNGSHILLGMNIGDIIISSDYGATWLKSYPADVNYHWWEAVAMNDDGTVMYVGEESGLSKAYRLDFITPPPMVVDFYNNAMVAMSPTQFFDTTTNDPDTWDWDFGDGSPHSTEQNPTHEYLLNGEYDVTLIANNSEESGSATKTIGQALSSVMVSGTLLLEGDLACNGDIIVTGSGKVITIPDRNLMKTFYNYSTNSYITANGGSRKMTSTTGNILMNGLIDGEGAGFESNRGPGCNSLLTDSDGNELPGYGATHAGLGHIS